MPKECLIDCLLRTGPAILSCGGITVWSVLSPCRLRTWIRICYRAVSSKSARRSYHRPSLGTGCIPLKLRRSDLLKDTKIFSRQSMQTNLLTFQTFCMKCQPSLVPCHAQGQTRNEKRWVDGFTGRFVSQEVRTAVIHVRAGARRFVTQRPKFSSCEHEP